MKRWALNPTSAKPVQLNTTKSWDMIHDTIFQPTCRNQVFLSKLLRRVSRA